MSGTAEMSGEGLLYKRILHTADEVTTKVDEIAAGIIDTCDPNDTLFVGLLNGALPFQARLMASIATQDPFFHPNAQSMIVSRYGENREPGQIRLIADLPPKYRDLTGRKVVLLDDLIDEGDTLEFATQHLLGYGAAEVQPVVLVRKHKDAIAHQALYDTVTFGFETPDVWLTGMGMDDTRLTAGSGRIGDEGNRWAPWIAEANS